VGLRSEEAVVSGYPFHLDLVGYLPLPASPLSQAWIQVYLQFFCNYHVCKRVGDETRHQCMINTYREHDHLEGWISCSYRLVKQYRLCHHWLDNNELTMYMWTGFPRTLLRTYGGAKALATVLCRRSPNLPSHFLTCLPLHSLCLHASDRPCVPRFVQIWQAEPYLVCSL
jgi:hypothetical protein